MKADEETKARIEMLQAAAGLLKTLRDLAIDLRELIKEEAGKRR